LRRTRRRRTVALPAQPCRAVHAFEEATMRTSLPTTFRFRPLPDADASLRKHAFGNTQSDAQAALVGLAAVDGNVHILGAGPDSIVGSSADELFLAGDGNDTVDGLGGNDTLQGEAGDDRLLGSGGNDSIVGGDGNDTIYGGVHNDTLSGGAGFDYVYGESGNDWLHAGTDGAWLSGGADNDTLIGDTGEDTLEGNAGNDSITAGDGADSLIGGIGADTLRGGLGNDTLVGDSDDFLDGSGSESLYGDAGDDQITGGYAPSRLDGGAGDDVILGGGNNDTIIGGIGADWMEGRNGDDSYVVDSPNDRVVELDNDAFAHIDTVTTGIGAYTLPAFVENLRLTATVNSNGTGNSLDNILYAASGNNVLNGAGGTDMVSYFYATSGVTVTLATTTQQATGGSASDTLFNFENLQGSAYADTLTGSAGANVLRGGAGDDLFIASGGTDQYFGDDGNDTVDFSAAAGGLVVDLRNSAFQLTGGTASSFLAIENLIASAFADSLFGTSTANVFVAGAGNDTLRGLTGADTLTGGAGADVFTYLNRSDSDAANADTILDFTVGEDRIDLVLPFSGTLTFIGSAAFTASGQVRYDAGVVYVNTGSDFNPEMVINVAGAPALTAMDFIL
jgi:Ca2+-binding RTX toxin-like protein